MRRRFVKVNGEWRRVREVRTVPVRLTCNEISLLRQLCHNDRHDHPLDNRTLTIMPKLTRALARHNKKGR